jgi:hypothetical protein
MHPAKLGNNLKPQILVPDLEGRHNQDLSKTASRILAGATWKKQRVVVMIPSAASIPVKVAFSHWNLIFPPNQQVYRMLCLGMEVGDAYSNAMDNVLAHPELCQWEYVLTVETDNCPPPDGLLKLIERMENHPEMAAISGCYFTKGEGGACQIWGDISDPQVNYRPQPPDPNGGLVECYGLGMGFVLHRISMFRDKKLRRPFFKTNASANGVGTQDLHFWSDARKNGYRCAVDCSVKVGHYDHDGKFGPPETMW